MNNGRRVELDVTYNNAPFAGQVGAEIESLTYVDNAADDSDSIDITLDAQDSKWLHGWLPEEGATLRPRIIGRDWNGPGDTHVMECGLFILDDVAYQDAPTTLQVGGVTIIFPGFLRLERKRQRRSFRNIILWRMRSSMRER